MSSKQMNALKELEDLDISILDFDESEIVSSAAASSGSDSSCSTCGSSSCCA